MCAVSDNEKVRAAAAVIGIQSLWRGYHARQNHPDVLRVRHEMRARRSEDYIQDLRQKLHRYIYSYVGRGSLSYVSKNVIYINYIALCLWYCA